MAFSPGKKKCNYMCIDFFKGWHWILRNILKSYLPSIGNWKGNDILRQKANFQTQGMVAVRKRRHWWKYICKMLTMSFSSDAAAEFRCQKLSPLAVPSAYLLRKWSFFSHLEHNKKSFLTWAFFVVSDGYGFAIHPHQRVQQLLIYCHY